MKAAIAAKAEPIYAGFERFRAHPASQPNHVSRGAAGEIGRNPSANHAQFDTDANAAYHCTLMWCLTGDRAFAETAKRIVNAWSAQLQRVTGADAVLMAGLGPFKLINAAELLRHTDAGWSAAEAERTETMLRRAIYPALQDFALFANGNWDTAAIKTLLALGVFCNDLSIYERALRYYVAGAGNGRLTHYIINDSGQCQESGRDMGHTQLGLAHLGDAAEIAWNQGLDLYGYADNRLLKGFEYTARYNLGEDVPFAETLDRTGKYHHKKISPIGRGVLRPVFEQVYHHYVNRAGRAAPWTQQAAEKLRPEGASRPAADHPGFGTLFYARPQSQPNSPRNATSPPRAPAGLIARGRADGIALTWIPAIAASHYTVKRSNGVSATPAAMATNLAATTFTDTSAAPGRVYSYVVTATNALGESAASFPVTVSAGLPAPWQRADVGQPAVAGETLHDGTQFTLEAGGNDRAGRRDPFHFAYQPFRDGCMITARIRPTVSSQFSQFGLMIRDSLTSESPHAALLLSADSSQERERPAWHAQLIARAGATPAGAAVAAPPLLAPQIAYGRLVQPCWLRLERRGARLTAAISVDGESWTVVGTTTAALQPVVLVGLTATSRLSSVTTTVTFDHVTVSPLGR